MSKAHIYEDNIRRSITEMYERMEDLLHIIPEGTDEDDLTESQLHIIEDILSMEEEWIMDPDIRREASIIEWIDDNDND